MSFLLNKQYESGLIDQLGEAAKPSDLSRERIEAAFVPTPESTEPKTSKAISTELPTITGQPRGLRFSAPPMENRLIGFVTEHRWQGYVTGVNGEKFQGIVFETSGADEEIEEVEFEKADVASLMRDLIVPGGVFFWDVGFTVDPSGQRVRQSIISFPMIPVHTKKDRLEALQKGRARYKELGWGELKRNDSPTSERSSQS